MKLPTDDEMKEFQKERPRTYKRIMFWVQVFMWLFVAFGVIYLIYLIFGN